MEKSKKRSLVSGLAALALVLLLLYIVFRDKLPEIISALSEVSVPGVCLLLAMGLGYQLIDSAMCMTLLRSRLPELNLVIADLAAGQILHQILRHIARIQQVVTID